jgi:hypothetical protein
MQFMLPCTVEIHHAKLRLSSTSVAASPSVVFMKHAKQTGDAWYTVRYKGLNPQSAAVIEGDELVFQSVSTEDRHLLLETLSSIIRFNHRLQCMINDLCKEIPSYATVDTDGGLCDMLHVSIPKGQVDINHESDIVGVYGEPMFGSLVHDEHGPITQNGCETGVLLYNGQIFPGAEFDDDEVVGFTFVFPEEEAQIRQLFRALTGILFSEPKA